MEFDMQMINIIICLAAVMEMMMWRYLILTTGEYDEVRFITPLILKHQHRYMSTTHIDLVFLLFLPGIKCANRIY